MTDPIKACLKCGTDRNDMRWPFEMEWLYDHVDEHLKVSCGRCRYEWIEPLGNPPQGGK